MKEIDKLISALYLAKSDNREKMLSDLILNVLFTFSEPLSLDEIIDFIKLGFHLEPIKFEVQNRLEYLLEEAEIKTIENRYLLTEESRKNIHLITIKAKEESDKRYLLFVDIVHQIFDGIVVELEMKELWSIFNEYLLECFMVFGRKAIDIFLPYKDITVSENDDIHKIAIDKLSTDKLKKIFKVLVVEYPERLSELELRYLSALTSRAEKFYSLGIEKSEYEKIKSLKIKDLIILLDTNVLYSILNLHVHPERAAIYELIKLSKEKVIDLRLVYLPKTYSELQQAKAYLENVVSRENFKPAQIRALLCSDQLDPFARKYYETKLANSDTPHPTESLKYASDVLMSKGIIIYNEKFEKLVDDEEYLNKKIAEYLDFQHYFNNLNEERGYDLRLNKSDKKIEHDIFLREAVKILKSKFKVEDELNFICLTLDNSIVHFDHYRKRKNNVGLHKAINPNFTFPSTLLKQLRPFIPIVSQDYRKAFITSLTAPSFEYVDNTDSILLQKSIAYFKNMGIEDEEIIIKCIRRELFLKDFENELSKGTAEEYIKSELAKELDIIKAKMDELAETVNQKEQEAITILNIKDNEKIQLLKEIEEEKKEILESKNKAVKELNNDLQKRDDFIDELANRIQSLEETNKQIIDKADYELRRNNWLIDRDKYIEDEWEKELKFLRKSSKYFLKILLVTFIPVITGLTIKVIGGNFVQYLELHGISQWWLWGFLAIIQLFEFFGRTYLFDKEKVKLGKKWLFSSTNKKNEDIIFLKKQKIASDFIANNPEPQFYKKETIYQEVISEFPKAKVS